jgi:hypothetical protein
MRQLRKRLNDSRRSCCSSAVGPHAVRYHRKNSRSIRPEIDKKSVFVILPNFADMRMTETAATRQHK